MLPLTIVEQKLVEENHNLIYGFINKRNLNFEEYYDILALSLCRAAKYFDASKGCFSTIANQCMVSDVASYMKSLYGKSKIPTSNLIYLDASLDEDNDMSVANKIPDGNYYLEIYIESDDMYRILYSMLDEKEKQIAYYKEHGFTEAQIAKKMGCSQPNIHFYIKKIQKKWNKFYN